MGLEPYHVSYVHDEYTCFPKQKKKKIGILIKANTEHMSREDRAEFGAVTAAKGQDTSLFTNR